MSNDRGVPGLKRMAALTAATLILSGCSGISIPYIYEGGGEHFIYNGHDFGASRPENYKKGVIDGCKTAKGEYSKDHTLFGRDVDYKSGWQHGRLHCVKGTPAHD